MDFNKLLLCEENVIIFSEQVTKRQVLESLSSQLFASGMVKASFSGAVIKREEVFPTGLPTEPVGVAIPHTDSEHVLKNALAVGAGHSFIIFMENAFPINLLNAVQNVPEVCRIFCATANDVEVIVVRTEQGAGIMGVVDGNSPGGVEDDGEIMKRKAFLRDIGYKIR